MTDIASLTDSMDALLRQIRTVFYPGKNGGGDAYD
jgi:hypothetical protein